MLSSGLFWFLWEESPYAAKKRLERDLLRRINGCIGCVQDSAFNDRVDKIRDLLIVLNEYNTVTEHNYRERRK